MAGCLDDPIQVLHELCAIGQIGQWVVVGQAIQRLLTLTGFQQVSDAFAQYREINGFGSLVSG